MVLRTCYEPNYRWKRDRHTHDIKYREYISLNPLILATIKETNIGDELNDKTPSKTEEEGDVFEDLEIDDELGSSR